jgi:hypothetical protein
MAPVAPAINAVHRGMASFHEVNRSVCGVYAGNSNQAAARFSIHDLCTAALAGMLAILVVDLGGISVEYHALLA